MPLNYLRKFIKPWLIPAFCISIFTISTWVLISPDRLQATSFVSEASESSYRNVSDEIHLVDFGHFTVQAPRSFSILKPTRPYANWVRALSDGKDTLLMHYGADVPDVRKDTKRLSRDTIFGQLVYYKQPLGDEKGSYELGFYDFDDKEQLWCFYRNPQDTALMKQLLRSIVIKGKEHDLHSKNFGRNIAQTWVLKSGAQLYEENCLVCHDLHESAAGPALGGILQRRDQAWLLRWLRNPQKLLQEKDTIALQLQQRYKGGVAMPAFSCMPKSELEAILQYVDTAR